MKEIKKSHAVIIAPGYTLFVYKDKILKFIEQNNVVIFGCQNMSEFIIPDYHFWSDLLRLKEFGHLINEKTIPVFNCFLHKEEIYKFWKKDYLIFKKQPVEGRVRTSHWTKNEPFSYKSKEAKRCRIYTRKGKIYGCIRDIGTIAVFWAFIQGASQVTMIGFDGYTLYRKSDLDNKIVGQHFYGKGHTDGFTYEWERKQDWDRYRTFHLLYKYCKMKFGFGFEIITPTIYNEFYNPSVLNIEFNPNLNIWKEPKEEEYEIIDKYRLREGNKFINYGRN
jgi:hypothetical protein